MSRRKAPILWSIFVITYEDNKGVSPRLTNQCFSEVLYGMHCCGACAGFSGAFWVLSGRVVGAL